MMRLHEKYLLLQVIDQQWKDHLLNVDHLKEGIGLRGYGQRDPLIEYKKESFELFQEMMERIQDRVVKYLWKLEVQSSAKGEREQRPSAAFAPRCSAQAAASPVLRPRQGRSGPGEDGTSRKSAGTIPVPAGRAKSTRSATARRRRGRVAGRVAEGDRSHRHPTRSVIPSGWWDGGRGTSHGSRCKETTARPRGPRHVTSRPTRGPSRSTAHLFGMTSPTRRHPDRGARPLPNTAGPCAAALCRLGLDERLDDPDHLEGDVAAEGVENRSHAAVFARVKRGTDPLEERDIDPGFDRRGRFFTDE